MSKVSKPRLVIIQTVIPDYRSNLFAFLRTELGRFFELLGGKDYFEKSVKSDPKKGFYKQIKNVYLFNRKLLFQFGFWKIILQKNVLVLEMNPRIISNWIILFIRKILHRKTVLWGHAWPRSGQKSKTDVIRGFMRSLSDEIIVYTATQSKELKEKMPKSKISFAANSVYFKSEMHVNLNRDSIRNIIYVGRLTPKKKSLFLVQTFHNVMHKLPKGTQLNIVGDGEEREVIFEYIKTHNLESKIKLHGHIGNYEALKILYSETLFSVSPGYVGLSITQSFSFGVPILISRNEPHSPEIEAAIEEENSKFFVTDNTESLSNEIVKFFDEKQFWIDKRLEIMEFCKNNYSIEAMSEPFLELIKDNE